MPPRPGNRHVTAGQLVLIHAHEGERRAPARNGTIRSLAVHFDRAHAGLAPERQEPNQVPDRHGAAPRGSRDHGARSRYREDAIDRQAEQVVGRTLAQVRRHAAERRA